MNNEKTAKGPLCKTRELMEMFSILGCVKPTHRCIIFINLRK